MPDERHGRTLGQVGAGVRAAVQLHEAWTVSLRYHSALVPAADAAVFLRKAAWFVDHAEAMWR